MKLKIGDLVFNHTSGSLARIVGFKKGSVRIQEVKFDGVASRGTQTFAYLPINKAEKQRVTTKKVPKRKPEGKKPAHKRVARVDEDLPKAPTIW
jgi:hypothetical protein